ncbi:FAR-RED impaired response 1-like protein [Tanacetum coccineum]
MEKETHCETPIEENREYREDSCEQQNYNKRVHDEGVEEPRVGMTFDTIEELYDFYATYGKKMGFGVFKRSSQKSETDDDTRYVTFACNRAQKSVSKSKNSLNPRPVTKTDCGARISVVIGADKKCHVSKVNLEHNHPFSPSKGRFYRCHRVVNKHVKRQLEIHQRAGVRMNKSFNTFVVQSGGYEDLPFTEKDCRNYIDKVKRLKFGEGDAEAIQGYFMKVQSTDREFFYAWELDEENRLKSLFWADARCRAAYEEFGDVVTFDTTYLTNKYEMPMAPFVGVNHHGQSTWLTCMSGRAPDAIITDQDQAMKNAVEIVFPHARHRWCLWHIMKKLPEKFGKHKKYKSIKYKLKKAVYDSLTSSEFEASWNTMLETYKLENNKWLIDLYAERQRWLPCFVKDIFWAGMSTTQRSESINSFFDKYLNKKTTLKQFVEQYENALRDRAEKENVEDFNSYNSWYPPITHYAMEEQMKHVLTNAKFKEFREELTGKMYCAVGSSKSEGGHIEYEVLEDVMVNGSIIKKHFLVWFKKGESHEECDIRCICRLFEFRGMLCRHALTVLINENIYLVPNKYILRRWRKDVKRRHTKVKVNYSDWVVSDVGRRYDRMCTAFSEVADLASELDEKCSLVLDRVNELKSEILSGKVSISTPVCTPRMSASVSDKKKIRTPKAVQGKGRPAGRLKSTSEKIITRYQKKKKKLQDADLIGCGAENSETMKKRSKKEKEGNKNDFSLPSDTNHSYANFPLHYDGFIPSYAFQHPLYHSQANNPFHQVSPVLQHIAVQMHQSSHLNSIDGV